MLAVGSSSQTQGPQGFAGREHFGRSVLVCPLPRSLLAKGTTGGPPAESILAGVFWASPSTVPFGKRDHKGSAGREPCGKVFKKCFKFLNTLQQSVQKFVVNVWTPCSKVFKQMWLIEHCAANCSNIVVIFWTLCGKVFKILWLIFEHFAAKCSKIVVDFWTFKKCGSFLNTLPHGVQKLVVVLSM